MNITECKHCNHRTVCKYIDRFSALQDAVNRMLVKGEDALFMPIVVCRQHEGKQMIVQRGEPK